MVRPAISTTGTLAVTGKCDFRRGFAFPLNVAVDQSNTFTSATGRGYRIPRFTSAGDHLYRLPGTGVSGSHGNNGPALSATLNHPAAWWWIARRIIYISVRQRRNSTGRRSADQRYLPRGDRDICQWELNENAQCCRRRAYEAGWQHVEPAGVGDRSVGTTSTFRRNNNVVAAHQRP